MEGSVGNNILPDHRSWDLFPFFLVGLVFIRVSDLQRPAALVLAWGPGVVHLIPPELPLL